MTIAKILAVSLCMGFGAQALAADQVPTPATPAKSEAKAETAASDGVTPAQAKMFRSAGYKVEVRNGLTYYCRKEARLGTRFESKVCGTADELLRSTTNSQELVSTIQRTAIAPAPGNGH
jgi:hypothetical protein